MRVGDTTLIGPPGGAATEVRLRVARGPGLIGLSDVYGVVVLASVSNTSTMFEATRIGYNEHMRTLFVDRGLANHAQGAGWPTSSADGRQSDRLTEYSFALNSATTPLDLVVLVDGALLEICTNNRTVVASVALTSTQASTRVGVFGLGPARDIEFEAYTLGLNG